MSEKRLWFVRLARSYVRRRLRTSFDGVWVAGLDAVRAQLALGPVILAPNHVAWWDAFVCVALEEALDARGHCVMDAKNLAKLPFFAWLGALPLDRSHPKKSLRDLQRASAELTGPGDMLIVFPQGRQCPAHLPLRFQRGIEILARQTRLPVIPVGLRYDYLQNARARVHVAFGSPRLWNSQGAFLEELEGAVQRELRRIDQEILRQIDERETAEPGSAMPSEGVGHSYRQFAELFAGGRTRLPIGSALLTRIARGTGQ